MSFTRSSKNSSSNLNSFSTPLEILLQKGGPVTRTPKEELLALYDSFTNLLDKTKEALSDEPRKFTFGNQTYIHIPGTENFTVPDAPVDEDNNPLITFTPLQIMKATFPATRTWRRSINPTRSAEVMFWLGDSARYKIIRAVQLHYGEPPVTPETDQYTAFFQYLSENVGDHWMVQQQYSSCKWAAPKNEPLATSLLLHYGWAQKYQNHAMAGNCIYQMRRASDGIHLILSEPHSYNDRLYAACARAAMVAAVFNEKKHKAPYELLFKEACRVFFAFDGYYVSITASYRQAVLNKIQSYCLHLNNALDSAQPIVPFIDEPPPEECIEVKYDTKYNQPEEYILKWEDFIFENEVTSAKQRQVEDIAYSKALETFSKKTAPLNLDGEYTYAELLQYCNDKNFTTAKKYQLVVPGKKIGRKQYWKLNYERS